MKVDRQVLPVDMPEVASMLPRAMPVYSADGSTGSGIGGSSPSKMKPLYSALEVGSSGAMVTMTADRSA